MRTARIYTNQPAHWDGCDWGDMQHGYSINVRAYQSDDHWIATAMRTWHHTDHHARDHATVLRVGS